MSEYPRTVRELYPEDTRWGEGIIPAPLGGVIDDKFLADLDQTVKHAKEVTAFFEDKYPDFRWWETDFVESRPAVSLLMQSVNQTLAFHSFSDILQLQNVVAEQVAGEFPAAEAIDVYGARLACKAIERMPDGLEQLLECVSYMTNEDQYRLTGLLSGKTQA